MITRKNTIIILITLTIILQCGYIIQRIIHDFTVIIYLKGGKIMGTKLKKSLKDNIAYMQNRTNNSADFTVRQATICGIDTAIIIIEGMARSRDLSELIIKTFLVSDNEIKTPQMLYDYIQKNSLIGQDVKEVDNFEDAFMLIMSGFAMYMVDGVDKAFIVGVQGFEYRTVSEPSGETNLRGSKEGFIEVLKRNLTLVRRRIKSPDLVFEMIKLGRTSKTDVALIYVKGITNEKLITDVKERLSKVEIDVILESGYLTPFLEGDNSSIFTNVGTTERPDTLAAKVNEGRVGIIVDGTPYALIVPYLFSENFQSVDDYSHRPFYASFIRVLKYISFFLTILLPGLYVGASNFHPEIFPSELLYNVVSAQKGTPFPLMIEAIIIHFIFEIMKEAGLRLPKQIGHAVSIVGGLVIGSAAVTAGLIGAPMLIIVAVTAISVFVVPSIYEPIAILRFLFIILGGLMGFYGIALGLFFVVLDITKISGFGVPYTSPLAPFTMSAMRDVIIRKNWIKLQKNNMKVQSFNGVHIEENDGESNG